MSVLHDVLCYDICTATNFRPIRFALVKTRQYSLDLVQAR